MEFAPDKKKAREYLTRLLTHHPRSSTAHVLAGQISQDEGQLGTALAEFLKAKLAPLGFEIDIVPTPQAGKSHFIARLRGNGSKRPVLIAGHADVVGVEREKWTVDPFAGLADTVKLSGEL